MSNHKKTIYVLGAGASGMVAAIFAAKNAPSAGIILVDHNSKPGRKILSTGNGKCNLSNRAMGVEHFATSSGNTFIADVLAKCGVNFTEDFFQNLGLLIKEKHGGYLYPNSEQASSVSKILALECERLGIVFQMNTKVTSLTKYGDYFRIGLTETIYEAPQKKGKGKPGKPVIAGYKESVVQADYVVNCLGGPAGQNLGATYDGGILSKGFGHTLIEQKPALVSLRLKEDFLATLSGVRLEAKITLSQWETDYKKAKNSEEFGEIIFTDYGISGIPVMQLSYLVSEQPMLKTCLTLDLLPELSMDAKKTFVSLRTKSKTFSNRSVEEAFCGMLPQNLLYVLLKLVDIEPTKPANTLSEKEINSFTDILGNFVLVVEGTNGFSQAQAASGGVSLQEIDAHFQSIKIPKLYFAGEVLDVVGQCGGYNLQWAWASGAIAGEACGKACGNGVIGCD